MNVFTQTIQVTRLDYWGQPYTATVIDDKRRDLGAMWRQFTAANQQPTRDTAGQHGRISKKWMDREAEKQLREDESKY